MAKVKGAIVVDTERCKGCEVCIDSCKPAIISMSDKVNGRGYHYACLTDRDACTGCINCGIICPDGVITVYRYKLSA
jgi:2-oxoglutarate ferredoxin oxidoreductase subunit delta